MTRFWGGCLLLQGLPAISALHNTMGDSIEHLHQHLDTSTDESTIHEQITLSTSNPRSWAKNWQDVCRNPGIIFNIWQCACFFVHVSVLVQLFIAVTNIWETLLKERKTYFGSQFPDFQPMVTWSHHLVSKMRPNIMVGACSKLELLTLPQPGNKEKEKHSKQAKPSKTPPSQVALRLGPTSQISFKL
jgi:hypothetical protein